MGAGELPHLSRSRTADLSEDGKERGRNEGNPAGIKPRDLAAVRLGASGCAVVLSVLGT